MEFLLNIKQQILVRFKNYSKRSKLRKTLESNLNYLSHGVNFESLGLDMSLQEYIQTLFPKHTQALLELLPALETLDFLHAYSNFQKDFLKLLLKTVAYSLVLMVIGILLSYFFLYRFEPSIGSLLGDFGSSTHQLKTYRFIMQGLLFSLNLIMIVIVITFFFLQSHDNRVLLVIILLPRWPFLKELLSFQYSKMLNLFLQFDMKTSSMVMFLRKSSLGVINRWLSYHIESQLDKGVIFPMALDDNYFDERMIEFVKLGYQHNEMHSYLDRYCRMMDVQIKRKLKAYGALFKTFVFTYLVLIVAIYYSVLYLPLQLLEVL